jgi:hypothetical protein
MLCTLFYNSVYCSLSVVDVTLFRPSVDIYYAGFNGQSPSVYSVYIYLYIRTDLTMSDRRYVEYRLDGIDNTRGFIIVHTLGCFVGYR